MSDVVALEGVSLLRGGRPILSDVDWTIRDGERWAVLGPNGAGKTTLLEVASLYLYPSSGRVTVLGAVHGRTDIRPLRARIGYASAALARLLHADAIVLDAVATGRTGVLDPYWATPGPEDVAAARGLLERLGAGSLAGRRLGSLSEGERQRIQIARALMADPDLLVLDEPAAGLDLGAREVLVRSLAGLAADPAVRAIAFVTHHVEEIPPGFSHVLLLRDGRVVGAGPIDAVLTSAHLRACFGVPLSVERVGERWTARATEPDAPGSGTGTADGPADGPGPAPAAAPSGPVPDSGPEPDSPPPPGRLRDPDGRLKAYRPLAAAARLDALDRALRAYAAGDFFVAHEILEPAWMGTDDQAERSLYQGLIKLAAAGVHAVRGNAEGTRRNLHGAAIRLARVPESASGPLGEALGRVDLAATRGWIDAASAVLDESGSETPEARTRRLARLVALSPAPVCGSIGRATGVPPAEPVRR